MHTGYKANLLQNARYQTANGEVRTMTTASGLGFQPGTLQTALRDNREHVCTPEDCPPCGGYYVSCVDDNGNVFLMAGHTGHRDSFGGWL